MRRGVRRRIGRFWLLFAPVLLMPTLSLSLPAAPAASETPICQQTLPEPTSGAFTLDRTSLGPGERTIGVVGGLASWPVHLFGGSGETFEACLPGAAAPQPEVMAHDNAAYFLVQSYTPRPGTYRVGLLFYEGGQPLSGGRLVRFDATLTVTANATPVNGITPACRQSHPAATTGRLVLGGSTLTGGALIPSVQGLDPRLIDGLNEYDHFDYIACLAGQATPITDLPSSDSTFVVWIPKDLAPGSHSLIVIGPGMGGLVTWRMDVRVVATPQLRMSPSPAPAGSWLAVSGSCENTQSISLISGAFDNSGRHAWRGSLFGELQPGPNGVWRFPGKGSTGSFSGRVLLRSTATGDFRVIMLCSGGLSYGTMLTVRAGPLLRLSPNPAPAGSWLSVSGRCAQPQASASLISAAFDNTGQHDWDGTNGVWQFAGTGSAGSFSGQVLLKSSASGAYQVTMRCGGGRAAGTTLTVQPVLAATGRPVLPGLVIGGLSLLFGLVLVRAGRRPAG